MWVHTTGKSQWVYGKRYILGITCRASAEAAMWFPGEALSSHRPLLASGVELCTAVRASVEGRCAFLLPAWPLTPDSLRDHVAHALFTWSSPFLRVHVSSLISESVPTYSCPAHTSISTTSLDAIYMRSYVIFVFLLLTCFTLYDSFRVHPRLYTQLLRCLC